MQLFDFVLAEFEIVCHSQSKSQQLMKLNQWLLERYKAGETTILIVDEAAEFDAPGTRRDPDAYESGDFN